MCVNLLQFLRKTHLHVGVFTAPAILFFAFTGALQTFSLHEAARDGSYKPAQWILVLAQIHKKQTAQVPQRKAPVSVPAASLQRKADPATTPPAPTTGTPLQPSEAKANPLAGQTKHNPLPLRFFFLVVGLSLFVSTVSGLYLAWKYRRNRIVIAVLLLGGILVPLALMQL